MESGCQIFGCGVVVSEQSINITHVASFFLCLILFVQLANNMAFLQVKWNVFIYHSVFHEHGVLVVMSNFLSWRSLFRFQVI